MATRFLNTGEAFLSASDKRFARAVEVHPHIVRDGGFSLSPTLVSVALAVAIIGLALYAISL